MEKVNLHKFLKISNSKKGVITLLDDEYHDKDYTIILEERIETNENPYNNTIIFLGEEGLPALEYVEMAYNLRNTKEKAIEEEEEKAIEEEEEKEQNVFNLDKLIREIENIKKSDEKSDKSEESDENDKSEKSDEKSDKSEESEEEYDTNKYISLSEILKILKEKGYTDTIIIDLSCSVGYDPRSSRALRRASKDNYGGK